MCITFCLWNSTRSEVHNPLVFKNPRLKTAIGSILVSALILSLMTFLVYSYKYGNIWHVYPVPVPFLVHTQMFLLYGLFLSYVTILISAVLFRFFILVAIAVAIIQVTMPLLVLIFLTHLLWEFHIFYVLAAKASVEVSILFFYFYQGFEKQIMREIERADDSRWQPWGTRWWMIIRTVEINADGKVKIWVTFQFQTRSSVERLQQS